MPTYDYKCNECDKVFEYFQPMSAEHLKECLCEKKGSVSRMISGGSGIIFKGSGFYVTDYKKSSSDSSSKTETSSNNSSSQNSTSSSSSTTPTNKS